MSGFVKKYTTAITAALFLVVAASGVAMFFHVGRDVVGEMHEWLAVMLVLAVGLHVFKNWAALMTYIRRRTIFAPLALALVAAAAFIVPASLSGHSDPMSRLVQALSEAKLSDIAPVLGVAPDALESALKEQGYVIASAEQHLSEIARNSQKPARAALMAALKASDR
jgi:Domain of unknown function (DUF4405)